MGRGETWQDVLHGNKALATNHREIQPIIFSPGHSVVYYILGSIIYSIDCYLLFNLLYLMLLLLRSSTKKICDSCVGKG